MLIAASFGGGNTLAIDAYTSQSEFLADVFTGFDLETESVEAIAAGTPSPELLGGEMTLSSDAPELIIVSNRYTTTSPGNYLGLQNSDAAFKANDTLSFTFMSAIGGFGLYLITEENLQAGDFRLSTAAGEIDNSDIADAVLADGRAYFIGFTLDEEDTEVSEVTLTASNSLFDFNYNIDDLVVASLESGSSSSSSSSSSGSGQTGSGNRSGSGASGITSLLAMIFILIWRQRRRRRTI